MKRFISFILVIVVLLLASFLYLVKQPFVQEQLKTAIKNYVQRELERNIEFESVELSLWGPRVVGKKIRIFNKTEDLSFDSLKARISLLNLSRGRLKIASVTASGGKIILSRDWKAPEFKGADKRMEFSLPIPRIYFRDLAFQYQGDTEGISFKEAKLTARALWKRVYIDFETPFLNFETKNGKREDVHVVAELTLDSSRLRIHKLKALDQNNFFTSSGAVYFEKSGLNLDVQFRTEFEVADYHFLNPKIDFLTGKVLLEGKLRENLVKPKIQADISAEALALYNQNLSRFKAQFVFYDNKVDVLRYSLNDVVQGDAKLIFNHEFSAAGQARFLNFPLENITLLKNQSISGLGR